MTINETIVKELENTCGKPFADELKKYLFVQYGQEPFPHVFIEQDLYANIERDIRAYEVGELDITLKSQSKRWQDEREFLQNLYIEKCREARELTDYVAELEEMLAQNGLKLPKRPKGSLNLILYDENSF